jgi:hypothetical protein
MKTQTTNGNAENDVTIQTMGYDADNDNAAVEIHAAMQRTR